MLSYAGKKRINIIWMCRDAGLIEFFLHKLDIFTVTKNSFALIYYTGKEELVLPTYLPLNFFIFQYRPNLEQVSLARGLPKLELVILSHQILLLSRFVEQVISGVVAAIHSGDGLPEDICEFH
jgi:hypothetical protein